MNKKDGLYCSIINGSCQQRKDCNNCKSYKKAVKEAYDKTMKMINEEYGIKKDAYQEQLQL